MSDSNWVHHPAVGGCLAASVGACLFFAGLEYQPDNRARHNQASGYEYRVAQPTRPIPAPPAEPRPKREEWRAESDLRAQWKAADWVQIGTIVGSILSVLGLIVTGAGLYFVRQTLRYTADATKAASESAKYSAEAATQAAKSVDIAERELKAAHRPVISIEASAVDLHMGSYQTVTVTVRNKGEPALVTGGRMELRLCQKGEVPKIGALNEDVAAIFGITSPLLDRGETAIQPVNRFKPLDESALAAHDVTLWLFGWIEYRDKLDIRREKAVTMFYGYREAPYVGRFIPITSSSATYDREMPDENQSYLPLVVPRVRRTPLTNG